MIGPRPARPLAAGPLAVVVVVELLHAVSARAIAPSTATGASFFERFISCFADAKRTRQDTADVTSSAANVERLRGEAARLETLSKAATDEFRKQEVAHSAAQEAQRAWEPAANLAAARDRQIQLHALGRVLDATDLDAYAQARRELTPLTGQLAEVNEELATLGRRVGELLVDDAALGLAPNVDDLQTRQELEKRRGVELTERRSGLADVREEMRRVAASLAPRSWDDASASASADALRATTSQLLIPVDVADRIHRGARDVFDIEKEILTETDEVATVRERLTDLDPGLGNPGVSSGVRESRGVRDQAWAEIKEPWLSGALPDDQTRVQLAGAVDARTRDADEASDHATIDAENTGRVLEVNAQLADRILHLNELRGGAGRCSGGLGKPVDPSRDPVCGGSRRVGGSVGGDRGARRSTSRRARADDNCHHRRAGRGRLRYRRIGRGRSARNLR